MGSVGKKALARQACWPEFGPQSTCKGGRGELTYLCMHIPSLSVSEKGGFNLGGLDVLAVVSGQIPG